MSQVDPRVAAAAAVAASVGGNLGAVAGAVAGALMNQITVEIDGLAKAAAVMREELRQGYRTQVPPVHDAMERGATIGTGILGAEWDHLRDRYDECIQATLDSLYNLDRGTQAMASAAEQIARNYRTTDDLARATVTDVYDALGPTQPPAPSAPPAPSGGTAGV
ncbi:hypothetical protein EF879_08620 [Micromonospora sp. HM5-17]|jgi:hypothetical protein|nr:hypothetical protein EF879_08620 [Micromonospora sp. HM5-17]